MAAEGRRLPLSALVAGDVCKVRHYRPLTLELNEISGALALREATSGHYTGSGADRSRDKLTAFMNESVGAGTDATSQT